MTVAAPKLALLPPYAVDLETHLVAPGLLAPPPVVGSAAMGDDNEGLLVTPADAAEIVRRAELVFGANIFYDLGVLVAHGHLTIEEAFQAFDEDRVWDVMVAQSLDAIARGHLFRDPRTGGSLRDPGTGKAMQRYSLSVCADLTLGLATAKENDLYRLRYALLEQVPREEWPAEATQYPKDDARNTLRTALGQIGEIERPEGSAHPGREPLLNLHDLPRQVRAAWALHLAAMWGYRTDPVRVAELEARVEKEHAAALASYVGTFIRTDGTEDGSAVKKATAKAYGAMGACARCKGTGKVKSETSGKPVNCKVAPTVVVWCVHPESDFNGPWPEAGVFANHVAAESWLQAQNNLGDGLATFDVRTVEMGCDGTGFDLAGAASLPRTEKGAVKTDRDTLMESGDDVLERYAMVSESEKLRGTYLPFLKQGLRWPINSRPNVLVESGRTSYSDPTQTFPKAGGVRECVVPRGKDAPVWEVVEVPDDYVLQPGEERLS